MRPTRLLAASGSRSRSPHSHSFAGCGGSDDRGAGAPLRGSPGAGSRRARLGRRRVGDVLLVTADGGASWKRQHFFLPQRGVDVAFPDAQTGWLVTDAGTVLATADGGAGWTVAEKVELQRQGDRRRGRRPPPGSSATPSAPPASPGPPPVLRTSDGGATWKRTSLRRRACSPTSPSPTPATACWSRSTGSGRRATAAARGGCAGSLPMTVLTSVAAGDSRHAWVAGWGTQDGAPLVLATGDGGATWRRLPHRRAGARARRPADPADRLRRRGHSLWVTCDAGVLATADGGKTWALQEVAGRVPQAIAAADEQHVLATTQLSSSSPRPTAAPPGWPSAGRLPSAAARLDHGADQPSRRRVSRRSRAAEPCRPARVRRRPPRVR